MLLGLSVFSHSHINWRETLFFFVVTVFFIVSCRSRGRVKEIHNQLPLFLLIFLFAQFYAGNFHPEIIGWWYGSLPGWITLAVLALAGTCMVFLLSTRTDKSQGETSESGLSDASVDDLINRACWPAMTMGAAMFVLFVLNLDEISPRNKLTPDYSMYAIVVLMVVLFFTGANLRQAMSSREQKAATYVVGVILVFLVSLGSWNVYRVYRGYWSAREGGSVVLWHRVVELNVVPQIKSINVHALIALGEASRKNGDVAGAARYYKRTLEYDAFNEEAIAGLAEIAWQHKDWRTARETYWKLTHMRPHETGYIGRYVHACIADGRLDRAMQIMKGTFSEEMIALPEPSDHLVIGRAFMEEGFVSYASRHLERAASGMPDAEGPPYLLGRSYLKLGETDRAIQSLKRAIYLKTDLQPAYYHLGLAYEKSGNNFRAIEAYEQGASFEKKDIRVLDRLLDLYTRHDMIQKARDMEVLICRVVDHAVEASSWQGLSGDRVFRNGNMYWSGSISVPVVLKTGLVTFIVQAMGSPVNAVWPRMVVKLDGTPLGEVDVVSREAKEYEFAHNVKAGEHELVVSFVNDGQRLDEKGTVIEDRNLYVRNCRIVYGEKSASTRR